MLFSTAELISLYLALTWELGYKTNALHNTWWLMVLSSSLGALKYPPSDKKWSLLNHPKTALAISQDKKSVCSDVSVALVWVEWCGKQKACHTEIASNCMRSCRRKMKTEIAPGKEMRWSETTPHANPLFPGSQSGCMVPISVSVSQANGNVSGALSAPALEYPSHVFSIVLMRQAGS